MSSTQQQSSCGLRQQQDNRQVVFEPGKHNQIIKNKLNFMLHAVFSDSNSHIHIIG